MKSNTTNFVGFVVIVIIMIAVFIFDESNNSGSSPSYNPKPAQTRAVQADAPDEYLPEGPWPPVNQETGTLMSSQPLATNYYVVLDASGSMKNEVGGSVKMDAAKDALGTFINSVSEHSNVGLLTFSPVRERVAIAPRNAPEFIKTINSIDPSGGTPLVASIKEGFDALTAQAIKQSGYGRYILLIVTDGKSSDGDPSKLAIEVAQDSAIEVHVIGFGLRQHTLKIPGVTNYHVANSVSELIRAFESVVASESEEFADPSDFSSTL